MKRESTRILYVGGWGRSGSTLFAMVLGQMPAFVAVGEIREIWRRGLSENRRCGCGATFRECEFWTDVGERAFGGWAKLDLDEVLRLRYRIDRQWMVPLLAVPARPPIIGRDLSKYLEVLGRLFDAIRDVSGARWIVDSSKLPSQPYLLRRAGGVDLRLVHLVRDSRGVAYSWSKKIDSKGGLGRTAHLDRYGPVSAALRYDAYNLLTAWLRPLGVPAVRIRYEDFVADPRDELGRALTLVGEEVAVGSLAVVGDGRADLRPTHTADGNPVRFATGPLRIRLDDEWRREMPARNRRVVTALTSPLLAAYGYVGSR